MFLACCSGRASWSRCELGWFIKLHQDLAVHVEANEQVGLGADNEAREPPTPVDRVVLAFHERYCFRVIFAVVLLPVPVRDNATLWDAVILVALNVDS